MESYQLNGSKGSFSNEHDIVMIHFNGAQHQYSEMHYDQGQRYRTFGAVRTHLESEPQCMA